MKKAKYSSELIQKRVREEILSNPLTLFSGLVGLLSLVGFLLFQLSLLSWLCMGAFIIMGGSVSVNYFLRRETFEREQTIQLQKEIEKANKNELLKVKKGLDECLEITDGDDLAVQARAQFDKVHEKFELFKQVILSKLAPTEVTYGRFMGTAEQVYLSVLDNLDKVIMSIKTADTFDLDYLEERYEKLETRIKNKQNDQADLDEFKTIQERIDMREDLLEKINIYLTQNERALTQMDHTTVNLNDIETKKGRGNSDIESTLEELEELANRANKYGRRSD